MDPVSSNGYSHSQEVPWAIKQRFPCTTYLVLLVFIPRVRGHEFSEAVFNRSKSSHFVGYLIEIFFWPQFLTYHLLQIAHTF